MTRLAKSTAPILATLALSLCLPGKLSAQGVPVAQPATPATAQAAKPATPAKPVVKPTTTAPAKSPTPATAAKPAVVKPATAQAVVVKPATPKPVMAKPATAPKPVAVKPVVVKPAAKAAVPGKTVGTVAAVAAKPADKSAEKPAETKAADAKADAAPEAVDTLVAKRDPFVSPLATKANPGGGPVLPPGKAGLVVATVRIDGTVKSGDGMVAMVSNPEKHVYFVREGDRLYDGDVETISLDGVTFRENSKDAFGKPVERMVTKRVYQSAGESQ
jgi:hypothetical protein